MKYIREWIEACEVLLDYYEKDVFDGLSFCPLCEVGFQMNPDDACQYCLWNVFEGMDCSKYLRNVLKFHKYGGWTDVYDRRILRDLFWVKARIPMLTDWIKRLKKIQARRKK